jgi:hypothetical protein
MDKQSWKHGKEINSEEEYNEQSSALAEELQRIYTPAQVAEIAAQHMLYVNEWSSKPSTQKGFHSSNEHYRSLEEQHNRLLLMWNTLVKNMASMMKLRVDSYAAQLKKDLIDSRHKINRERQADALKVWEESALTNMSEFARRNHEKYGVTERRLCQWLSKHEKAKREKGAMPLQSAEM